MGRIEDLFENMWTQYSQTHPVARKVHSLLHERGENIVNDHIAFRTFNISPIGLDTFIKIFTSHGYAIKGEYRFPEKKLYARHLETPKNKYPKIFISELEVENFSQDFQSIAHRLASAVDPAETKTPDFVWSGQHWNLPFADYQTLEKESSYAAWLSAFGFCPNHFTVSANDLTSFTSLAELNQFLKNNGFKMNDRGGEIKGSQEKGLEQSAVMAEKIFWEFSDGNHKIPGCYYEFAKRYKDSQGNLYHGFITESADKIYESTDGTVAS